MTATCSTPFETSFAALLHDRCGHRTGPSVTVCLSPSVIAAKKHEVGEPIAVQQRRNRGLYFHFGILWHGRTPPRLAKGLPATPCFIVSGRSATLRMTSMSLLVVCWNATGIKEGWCS